MRLLLSCVALQLLCDTPGFRNSARAIALRRAKPARFAQLAMNPWRPGNENLPSVSVGPRTEGEKDMPDAHLPTFNIHLDYKPVDWILEEKKANDTVKLRHELTEDFWKQYWNQGALQRAMLQRDLLLQDLQAHAVRDAVAMLPVSEGPRLMPSRFSESMLTGPPITWCPVWHRFSS